ncbi:MAG: alpha/beta family hydrolase [Candidatus Sericytochromatia bacterium]|nr:alpha/beta family hydrolase [Candidatus Sericytochromatia bacterium]
MRVQIRSAHPLENVVIDVREGPLYGVLGRPPGASSLVVFAHGTGSSRFSPRNQYVAAALRSAGLATLLFDLLTPEESAREAGLECPGIALERLAGRLQRVSAWVAAQRSLRPLRLGYFGASTGAAAALLAAAHDPGRVQAIVSRGGRPDLVSDALPLVQAPTLLIVGARDEQVIALNEGARARMRAPVELVLVPGAGHLFQEGNSLERVAELSTRWFKQYLSATPQPLPGR